MIEARECGCRTVIDGSDHVVSVGTCPRCLPCGAITWLIENGRQLELFGDTGVALRERGLIRQLPPEPIIVTDRPRPEGGLPF